MRVGIIGSGASGLCSARHALENGFDVVIFEQAADLGGTWMYTDDIGFDQYGVPVHTSMYKGLKTNLPKEIMGFPDFEITDEKISYVSQNKILNFLKCYAANFGIEKHIKYHNYVKNVKPLEKNMWQVVVEDVEQKEQKTYNFDAVMICNGHYSQAFIPKIDGINTFLGKQSHSHNYREPTTFTNQKVLIIGAGPSGLDLAFQISNIANKVYLSHHLQKKLKLPNNIIQKPDVDFVIETQVIFKDGTKELVDHIFYCTGYKYSFPFLDESCKITVTDNFVQSLYKHLINIEYPTMALIGIPFEVCTFQMFDLQARYFIALLKNVFKLPTKEDMYNETSKEMSERWSKGYCKRQAHAMGPYQERYYNDLARMANLKPIPPVMIKLREESMRRLIEDFANYRNDVYKILNENSFIRVGMCKEKIF